MVNLKKRSASAALMGVSSSEDEESFGEHGSLGLNALQSQSASTLLLTDAAYNARGFKELNQSTSQDRADLVADSRTRRDFSVGDDDSDGTDSNRENCQSDDKDGEILDNDLVNDEMRIARKPNVESDSDDGEIDEGSALQNLNDEDDIGGISIAIAVSKGGKDVAQHNVRYFMMDNVVCSHCGVKGHLSYDCPEEAAERRCFLCGKPGHDSKSCPDEACFYCGEKGHRKRDCPNKALDRVRRGTNARPRHIRFNRRQRRISPPRAIPLFCYVCGQDGHVDCSLVRQPKAVLSCCNCGQVGHAGSGCPEPPAERWVGYVSELQREKRTLSTRKEGGNVVAGRRGRPTSTALSEEIVEEAKRFREKIKAAVYAGRDVGFGTNRGRSWRESRGFM